tara:strand:- start:775 stop:1185 length:411 start_codon:yes stop_codon:yes gene_type:complete
MKAKVKRIDMAIHIQEICAKYNITVRYQTLKDKQPNYYARPATKEIHVRPTKNTGYYVSTLHEIGHILGDYQGAQWGIRTKEIHAWVYARKNALVWTETAERVMRKAMDTYGWGEIEKKIWKDTTDRCEKLEEVGA